VNKILIMTYGKLGDTFVLVPSINLVKEKFPNVKIDFFSEKYSNHNLNAKYSLQKTGLIDNFYLFTSDRNRYAKKIEKLYWLLKFRFVKYDCVFVLLPASSKELFARFERDIKIISPKNYFIPEYIEREYIDGKLKSWEPTISYLFKEVSNFLNTKFSKTYENKIKNYLYYKPLSKSLSNKNSIGICMGTDMPAKKWNMENFYFVLKYIIKKYPDIDLLFIGGSKKDEKEIDYIIQKLGKSKKLINLDIGTLYEKIYRECFLYLGVDTGIMHLFNLAQIPIISIFSARDVPGKWYPFGVDNYIFREYVECEDCLLRECPYKNKCIEMIKPEKVYKKVDEFIQKVKKV